MKGIVYRNHRKDSGWYWSRYTLANDRLTPGYVARCVETYGSVEKVMDEFDLTREQVETAVRWLQRKRRAAGRC